MKHRLGLVSLLLLLLLVAPVHAQEPNRAGLVVQYGEGQIETACVTFEESEISGFELLERSGLPVTYEVQGGTKVCAIRGEGCRFPAESCFCQCESVGGCTYWSYHRLAPDGTWQYSQVGAAASRVRPGDVEGWRWGAGKANRAPAPPVRTFEEICPVQPSVGSTAETMLATSTPAPDTMNDPPAPTITSEPATATTTVATSTGTGTQGSGRTSTVTPSVAPTSVPPEPAVTMPPERQGQREDGMPGSYLVFALLVTALGAAILWVRRE